MQLSKTWLEILKTALLHNLAVFKRIVGKKTKIAAVVKANAYGHGLTETITVLKNKADVFAVDNVEEALTVRKIESKKPIIVLGYVVRPNIKILIEHNISFVVYSPDVLKYIISLKLPQRAKVHIKIETGLNRQGVEGKDLLKILTFLKKHKDKIFLEGIYTHFANVEDTLDPTFAENQLKRFNESLAIVKSKGFNPPLIHTAASAATLIFKKSHFSMVRAGIGLYGLWPSRETKIALSGKKIRVLFEPVLTWKSTVAQVKIIGKGESVGYGRTWFAPRKSKIAIIPFGYSDGFDRKLSNSGKVIIRKSFAPVIGRVAMNMIMVDVSEIKKIKEGDEVIIIGKSGKLSITADEIAEKIGTINYEVISRINPLLPRIIV